MAPPQPDEPVIDPMYEPARPDEQERCEGDEQSQAYEEEGGTFGDEAVEERCAAEQAHEPTPEADGPPPGSMLVAEDIPEAEHQREPPSCGACPTRVSAITIQSQFPARIGSKPR